MDNVKVKIVGFACNERPDKDTNWLIQYALKAIEKFGRKIREAAQIETEFIDLADKKIRHCLNCDERWEIPQSGRPWGKEGIPEGFKGCIIRNDWLAKQWWPRIHEVDGYLFGGRPSSFVCTTKFRLLTERFTTGGIWYDPRNTVTNGPAGLISVGYGPRVGQENSIMNMATICKAIEMIEISAMLGAQASSGPAGSVRTDEEAKRMAVFTARRVAEFAVMQKITKLELGDLYTKEFIHMYHAPRPEGPYTWYRLDKEEEDYMMGL